MHKTSVFSLLLSLVCCLSMAQNKAERKVLEIEQARLQAQTKQDTNFLNETLDNALIYTHSSGIIESKTQYVRNVGNKTWDYRTVDVKELKATQVAKDLIVVNGKGIFVLFAQGKYITLRLSFTDVYRLTKKRWKMLLWQSARLPEQ